VDNDESKLAEKLTRVYLRMRDKKSAIQAEFKRQEDELNAQMDRVKAALLNYCREHGVDSVRTEAGLFYRSVKKRYWTSDWEATHKFIIKHKVPQLLEKRLNQTNVELFLEENPDVLPQGLNISSEYVISVRRK
jgi:hypothetical protein